MPPVVEPPTKVHGHKLVPAPKGSTEAPGVHFHKSFNNSKSRAADSLAAKQIEVP